MNFFEVDFARENLIQLVGAAFAIVSEKLIFFFWKIILNTIQHEERLEMHWAKARNKPYLSCTLIKVKYYANFV